MTTYKTVVIGQGYVGLPLAMMAVEAGHAVVGVELDAVRLNRLRRGESYVEDIANETLEAALASGRYHPTADHFDMQGFDVAVITVPTPLRDGAPDLSFVEAAAETIGRYLRPSCLVVLESTTYPGTTTELLANILERVSGLKAGAEFHLGYSPERIDPGNPTWNVRTTPKLVSGIDAESLDAVDGFYKQLVDTTVRVSQPAVAELAKLLENTFRHVNIALVNELAMFAADLDIDIWEAIDAASTKPFGYMRFTPGPGVGGHCLPIDPSYLSWQVKRRLGHSFRFVELANDVNEHMPDYVLRRLIQSLNRVSKSVKGSRVLLLGLSYKRNTGDVRESPGVVVATRLAALGADVRAADPHVFGDEHGLESILLVKATAEEIEAADAVVLLTDHDEFDYELVIEQAKLVLDTRHRLTGAQVEHL